MMKMCYRVFFVLAGLLAVTPTLNAQAAYSATRTARIEVGVGVLGLLPDYVDKKIYGVAFWGDYDFRRWIGAEVEVGIGSIITPDDISENHYFVGPRIMYHKRRFTVYGKIMVGRATITDQDNNQSSSYNAYAFGGGVEYQLARKFQVRADLEIQKWPNFEPNTLSPTALKIGVEYIIK